MNNLPRENSEVSTQDTMQIINLGVVGNYYSGKTCMLLTYVTNAFPDQYVPAV